MNNSKDLARSRYPPSVGIDSSARDGITPSRRPTRSEVRAKLAALADGSLSADNASDWAWPFEFAFGEYDDPVIDDGLNALQLAESQVGPRDYLYGPLDFAAWLEEFDSAVRPSDRRRETS